MTIVTAWNRSLTVALVLANRCCAIPLRASGGTDWLSARSMSSRSGAVYCVPVRPVRSSAVSAEVESPQPAGGCGDARGHARRRSGPREFAATLSGSGRASCCGTAWLSAITAVSGRGAARPARIEVATAVQNRRGVVGLHAPFHRRHQDLTARLGLRRKGAPQQRAERILTPRDRRVMLYRNIKRRIEIRRGRRIGPDARQRGRRRSGRTARRPLRACSARR